MAYIKARGLLSPSHTDRTVEKSGGISALSRNRDGICVRKLREIEANARPYRKNRLDVFGTQEKEKERWEKAIFLAEDKLGVEK